MIDQETIEKYNLNYDDIIKLIMQATGASRQKAMMIYAIENEEIPGDIIEVPRGPQIQRSDLFDTLTRLLVLRGNMSTHSQQMVYKAGHSGVMIALFLPEGLAARYALPEGTVQDVLPASELHLTLAYLDEVTDLSQQQKLNLHHIVQDLSKKHIPLSGTINGVGRFCNDEDIDPFVIIPDLPELPGFRGDLVNQLETDGIQPASDHGFTPHITLGYLPHEAANPFDQVERQAIEFPTISLILGEQRYDYLFIGPDMDDLTTKHLQGKEGKAALITRIGARHTKKEVEIIQKIHDLAADLGADCPIPKGQPPISIPVMGDLMRKGQLDAPNYRPHSGLPRCENCVYFGGQDGYDDKCRKFDFVADLDYVCDAWESDKPAQLPGYVPRSLFETAGAIGKLKNGQS